MTIWHLYLIRTRSEALYTGITTDVSRRFGEHCGSDGKGAKYLRARGPLTLVYHAKIGSRALALKAEHRVKKRQKKGKEQLVSEQPDGVMLLEVLGLQNPQDSIPET